MSYADQRVAFLTQHGKELLLGPMLSEKIGCELVRATGFDTDQLGTFTRDIDRPGTQLSAARFKARKAVELTGLDSGLGSEGAFGADPVGGLVPWNTEVIVWFDRQRNIDIVGVAQGPGGGMHRKVGDRDELKTFAEQAGFPTHGLVVRPDETLASPIFKGIQDWDVLLSAFDSVSRVSTTGQVFVEVDLRAHMNPSRQQMILRAAEDLIAKLRSHCPTCEAPGFWEQERIAGLPCMLCDQPTRMPLARLWKCSACGHSDRRDEPAQSRADPGKCDYCNP